jgi:PAS domain S-box-containing protein
MNSNIFFALLNNGALLITIATVYALFTRNTDSSREKLRLQISAGLILGMLGCGLMLAAYRFEEGIIFDTRSVLLCITGLFFGTVPLCIAMLMTTALRVYQGGTAMWTGISVIFTTGIIGLIWRHGFHKNVEKISWRALYTLGVTAHLAMLALMFLMPLPIALRVMSGIAAPVLILYPLLTAAIALLLQRNMIYRHTLSTLVHTEMSYRDLFENNRAVMLFTDPQSGLIMDANPAAVRFYGYSKAELKTMRLPELSVDQGKTLQPPESAHKICRDRHRLADGSIRDIELQNGSIVIEGKIRSCSFIQDITDRLRQEDEQQKKIQEADLSQKILLSVIEDHRKAERSLLLTQFALDHSADATFWINPDGSIVYVNLSACQELGYSQKELLGMTVRDIDPDYADEQWCQHWQELKEKGALRFETRHRTKDGRIFPVEIHATFMVFEGKEYNFAFAHDITERKKDQKHIEFEQHLFDSFMEAVPASVYFKDRDGHIVKANRAMAAFWNKSEEEIIGKTDFDRFSADQAEQKRRDEIHVMQTGKPIQKEEQSGNVWHFTTKVPRFDEDGNIAGIIGISWDITERKRMHEAIEKRIVSLTRPLDQADAFTFDELFDRKELSRILNEFSDATGVASAIFLPDKTEIISAQNITSLCRIVRATELGCANCRRSEKILEKITPGQITVMRCESAGLWDACVNIVIAGQHVANWTAGQVRDETYTEEQALQYAREIGADEEAFLNAFRKLPVMSEEHFKQIAKVLFSLVNQLSTSAYLNLQQARFIADEKRRTDELRQLSTAIEQSPETVMITDINGVIQYANPAFEKITGYSRKEALGKTPNILKSGRHDTAFYFNLWDTLRKGNVWEGRIINRRKDGNLFTEDASISPVKNDEGKIIGYAAIKRDISEEMVREELFQQSQKMEAVGQLAGGVAHDFNNILQAILGFSEILLGRLPPETVEHRNVSEIHKAAGRAADLTRQLLAFSRKQPVNRTELDLNATIRDSEVLLAMLLGETAELQFDLAPDLNPVSADHGQMTQVIMNLAVNARDAMPDGGRLTFTTENITFKDRDAELMPRAAPGTFVCLSVSDTGIGMSQDVKDHLFEPFFTTKDVGKGTGLGLPVVYGIVKQSKGWISVYSEPGLGSTFKIYLPATGPSSKNGKDTSGQTGGESILLVEDDADMRNMVLRILQVAGYQTVAVHSAEEALQHLEEHPAPFDLLFSDMVLPGKTGLHLADQLRQKYPDLPVLLYSGYRDHRERWVDLESKGYHFIQKPFTVTGLLAAVHETISGLN